MALTFTAASPSVAAEGIREIGFAEGVPATCQPQDIDLAPDGRPWFTCNGADPTGVDDKIGVIDPVTLRAATNDVTPKCGPYMGAFDGAGRYWFTLRDCGRIGMIDPATQKVTEHPVGMNATEPVGIAVDSSGRILVSLQIGNLDVADGVGRFDPGTQKWEYGVLGHTGTQLFDITVRPSGEIIVCDFFGGGVYRVDTSTLALSLLKIPKVFEPTWCREAPDGRLWITSHGATTYVMTVRAGDLHENYSFPQVGLLPYAIDFDRNGNAWFTEHLGNQLHRVSPSGVFGPRFPLKTPQSYPFSIAIDRKSCDAWVGENKEDRIAFVPGSMICPPTPPGIDPVIMVAAGGGGGTAVVVIAFLLFLRRKRTSQVPPEDKARIQNQKDEL
jgi:streptogramin lyase